MTKKELVEALAEFEDDRIIVLSRDEEGNGFAELADLSARVFSDGEIGLDELTPELKAQGYSEEDVMEDGAKAIVLWP